MTQKTLGKFEGHVSEKLLKAISDSDVYFNYAVWNSLADFRTAFFSPDSQACLGTYPDSCTFTGQIVKPIFVEGVCNAE